MQYQRILVIGSTGSGKTTMAKKIAKKLALPRAELDAFRWNPGWVMNSDEIFIQKVEEFLSSHQAWVIDGNYSIARHLLWPKADLILWIDLPFYQTFFQLIQRTIINLIKKKPLCNGNYESILLQLSRKSIFLWSLKTYRKRRKQYFKLMKDLPYPNVKFQRVSSKKEREAFLEKG